MTPLTLPSPPAPSQKRSARAMNLLFLTDAVTIGGSEVYLREMLPRLQARGHRVAAALPRVEGNRAIREQLQERGVWVHGYEALEEIPFNYDTLVMSTWFPHNHPRFRRLPGRKVALVHDQLVVYYPQPLRWAYQTGYRTVQAPNLRAVDRVITVSHWATEYLARHYDVPGVVAVPNGINVDRFHPATPQERLELRQKYGFERFTVLVPARVSLEKNHWATLTAARLLPEMDFIVVGKGEFKWLLEPLSPPNVHWWGTRHDMPDLYRAADVLLQPTLGENQSLATLEAMASGLAIVSSNIPAQRELIDHELEGLLVEPEGKAVAQALKRLAADPFLAATLGAGAREKVLNGHTLEQNADALEAALLE